MEDKLSILRKQLEIGEESEMIADFDREEFLKNLKEKYKKTGL